MTPGITGVFEVSVDGEVVHTKKVYLVRITYQL